MIDARMNLATKILKTTLLIIVLLVGATLFINPNPFGNQPSVIADETYFLTSAVKAIQDHTLPGWIHDPTAAYYGGILTYIVFIVVAVGGAVSIFCGAHANTIAPWIAFHWGDLMHIGRVINGLVVYISLLWIGLQSFRLSKKLNDVSIIWFCFFVITLLCSSSVFIPLAHTSKVWPLYIVIEIIAAVFVCSQEWRLQHNAIPMQKKAYFYTLFLLTLLSWSQVMFGSLAVLWIVDAFVLKHLSWQDIKQEIKRPFVWIAIGVAVLLHVSFVQNFFKLSRTLSSLNNVSGNAISSLHPWLDRFIWPWKALGETHPLLLALFVVALFQFVHKKNSTKLVRTLFIHVLLLYLLFYGVLGFGVGLRYVLPLTVVVTVFVALSLMVKIKLRKFVGALCALLALIVLMKTATLFWQPSSVKRLDGELHKMPISPRSLVIIKSGYFQVPILNKASMAFTDQLTDVPVFRRFKILEDSSFQNDAFPFTISVGVPRSIPRAQFDDVWLIDERNKTSCSSTKSLCFEFNSVSGSVLGTTLVAEGVSMKDLFKAKMIGKSYILLKTDTSEP